MTDFTFAHREEGFDNHIDMSIRNYSSLHDDVVNMSRYFIEDDTNVVDIGCSTGKTLASMIAQNVVSPSINYIGYEIADGFQEDMSDLMKKHDNLSLKQKDVRDVHFDNCSLVTSLFTLQFMSYKDRCKVIENIYEGLNLKGGFIFAEKIYASDSKIQDMLTFLFYDHKRTNFSADDILDKEFTLRNMLKPNTWMEIQDMLRHAGFRHVQPFWQNHLFVGVIAIK